MRRVFSKYTLPLVVVIILASMVSCEKDFKNIGVDLVDNDIFSSEIYSAETKGYTKDIDKNLTGDLKYNMLGYYSDNAFGSLTSSVASQLSYSDIDNPTYGENAVIDSVVVIIPYLSSLIGTTTVDDPNNSGSSITVKEYKLDSIFSNEAKKINLSVFELGTYLNDLDPIDPTQSLDYYNNQDIAVTGSALYTGMISPSANDTVIYINRSRYTDASLTEREVFKTDTITLSKEKPFMSIPLDKTIIKQKFQDQASSENFSSVDNFQHYFRGLMLQAAQPDMGNGLMYMDFSKAEMRIYYTESRVRDEEADEDLDGDDIMGETDVIVANTSKLTYTFDGKIVNLYERDYAGAQVEPYISNPDMINGDDKLFVQGAAGSDAIIHLFGEDVNTNDIPDEVETLRGNSWLINDAKLYLYIDQSNPVSYYPNRLYIYEIEEGENYQPYELFSQGVTRLSGFLVRDTDDNPDYYLFHLTDYVSEVIKPDSDMLITDFGIKAYDSKDDLDTTTLDTLMTKYNNNFKGVVLHGNDANAGDRRLKLELYYTHLNN